jgi:hypothetical protein
MALADRPFMRTVSAPWRQKLLDSVRILCAVLVGLTLAADLPRHLHLARVAHEICHAHGLVAHHDAAAGPVVVQASARPPQLDASSAAENTVPAAHEHCSAAVGSCCATATTLRPAGTPSAGPAVGASPGAVDVIPCPIAILYRAPKASPPDHA